MRLLHTVRELNFGVTTPIAVIALFTEAERDAMFVREADEAWRLERVPATATMRIASPPPSRVRCRRRAVMPHGSVGA